MSWKSAEGFKAGGHLRLKAGETKYFVPLTEPEIVKDSIPQKRGKDKLVERAQIKVAVLDSATAGLDTASVMTFGMSPKWFSAYAAVAQGHNVERRVVVRVIRKGSSMEKTSYTFTVVRALGPADMKRAKSL